jgi:hypothetical protein
MRLVVLSLFAALGCSTAPAVGDASIPDASMIIDMSAAVDGPTSCSPSCPPCDGGTVCVPAITAVSTCLMPCQTTNDCPAGLDCRQFLFVGGFLESNLPPVCASDQVPAPCGPNGATCTDIAGMTSCNSNNLATGFLSSANSSCGFILTACPNGCVTVDGGAFGSARCR